MIESMILGLIVLCIVARIVSGRIVKNDNKKSGFSVAYSKRKVR